MTLSYFSHSINLCDSCESSHKDTVGKFEGGFFGIVTRVEMNERESGKSFQFAASQNAFNFQCQIVFLAHFFLSPSRVGSRSTFSLRTFFLFHTHIADSQRTICHFRIFYIIPKSTYAIHKINFLPFILFYSHV